MFTNAYISCIYFFLIGLIVYEIRKVATLPAWPHYQSFLYHLPGDITSVCIINTYYHEIFITNYRISVLLQYRC